MPAPYRILVVDDSAFMRKVVSDIVNGDESLTVVETACNGVEAIEAAKRLRPDAVTMDVEMPVMTGLEALPTLLKEAPTPVIMLSSSTVEGAAATIRALELGAFDFVAKPSGPHSSDLGQLRDALLATLRAAVLDRKEETMGRLQPTPPPPPPHAAGDDKAPGRQEAAHRQDGPGPQEPPVPRPKPPARPASSAPGTAAKPPPPAARAPSRSPLTGSSGATAKPLSPSASGTPDRRASPRAAPSEAGPPPAKTGVPASKRHWRSLVAIGTSTGGPRALQHVLSRLPENFPAPVLVVQHMPPGFTKSLAQRLNTLCAIEVTEAEDGMEPSPGVAYIAPGGLHMTLRKEAGTYRLRLSDEPPMSGHRPSVDMLFGSLVDLPELDRTAVLMTGMGSDGAKGMKRLYDQGVRRTIAEDATSCIVYGMPRAAVELGCVAKTMPLDAIAAQIAKEVLQAEEV
ncbi:chemotaxis response regulator protein-glutamate methylesterase [Paenibacillus sp.]|uniref:protein-glutamate methylesterase/protein-glutamine glutaminase n=1 Tax=Paenibacillus sp. TaxID=58172 RepID=UPI002D306E6C|nr:chemotaxis response regulator protein-glutamate methylesterase [Paenibacillus sp.]HZG57870.1 chemotaxis response regulator protein-glutamate methylesterase [Paenibacillus sp.]